MSNLTFEFSGCRRQSAGTKRAGLASTVSPTSAAAIFGMALREFGRASIFTSRQPVSHRLIRRLPEEEDAEYCEDCLSH